VTPEPSPDAANDAAPEPVAAIDAPPAPAGSDAPLPQAPAAEAPAEAAAELSPPQSLAGPELAQFSTEALPAPAAASSAPPQAPLAQEGPTPATPASLAPVPSDAAPGPVAPVPQPQAGGAPEEPAATLLVAVPDAPAAELPAPSAQAPDGPSPAAAPEAAPSVSDSPAPLPEAVAALPALPQTDPGEAAPSPAPEAAALASDTPASDTPASPDAPPSDAAAASAEPPLPGRVALEGGTLIGQDAVRVNRPGAEEPEPTAETAAEPEPEPDADLPALRRFAAAWEPPEEARPLLSVVLIDDGTLSPDALQGLPVPVSVALDPLASDAADRMAAWRAAGVEVLALSTLPPNAQPVDVEVFLGASLAALPEAVAVLDPGEGGLHDRDATAAMALSRLAAAGLGAVLPSQGLGGAEQAQALGVPAAEFLRELEGADAGAIRRQLDDAARRAGQTGEAVLLGRLSPETLDALATWSAQRRAQEVTLAPVSALLSPPDATAE
jgi:hypothetical protein